MKRFLSVLACLLLSSLAYASGNGNQVVTTVGAPLQIGTPGYIDTAGTFLGQLTGSINNYLQFSIKNTSSGSSASTDFIAVANNGSATTHFIDLGINGSAGAAAPFTAANAAYLYSTDAELDVGALGTSGAINFYSGATPTLEATINGSGLTLPALTTPGILLNNGSGVVSSSAGALATSNGGTGQTSLNSTVFTTLFETTATTLGDLVYGGASGAPTRLAGQTSGNQILYETPNGSASAPIWFNLPQYNVFSGGAAGSGPNAIVGGTNCILYWTSSTAQPTCAGTVTLATSLTTATVQATGSYKTTGGLIIESGTAPSIASGFCSSPSITTNGTAAFSVTTGSSSCANPTVGVITMPAASHAWSCHAQDRTTPASYVIAAYADGSTPTTKEDVAVYSRSTGLAVQITASDVIDFVCAGF